MSAPNLGPNYAPFLLQHLSQLIGQNAPETKITPTGFLRSSIENAPNLVVPDHERLRLSNANGHIQQIRLSYLKRITPDMVSETDDCSNDLIPVYNDMTLDAPHFAKFSFYIADNDIARYMDEACKTVAVGQPATQFMQEHLRTLMTIVNGIVGKINQDLIGDVVFGVNAATNSNAAKTVNIEKDATKFDLSTGWAELLNDLDVNEVSGTPIIVGGGIFNKFMRSRSFQTTQLSGLTNSLYNDFKYYYDNYTQTSWGSNQIAVLAPGTYGFVDLQKYISFRAGYKGTSFFFQIMLPVNNGQSDGTAEMMIFDAQLKYIDCPTTVYNGYSNVTVNRGWQLIVSKNYGLFQQPTDAYTSGDVLAGNNGALRYTITNNV